MATTYAKRLAARLIEDHEDQITVSIPNDGFSDEVVVELGRLGFLIDRDRFRPDRFTIKRPATKE